MLVKELQSLCLDVRVLDENGRKIELQGEDNDDVSENIRDRSYYNSSEDEFATSGFQIDDIEADDLYEDDMDMEDIDEEEIEDGEVYVDMFDFDTDSNADNEEKEEDE